LFPQRSSEVRRSRTSTGFRDDPNGPPELPSLRGGYINLIPPSSYKIVGQDTCGRSDDWWEQLEADFTSSVDAFPSLIQSGDDKFEYDQKRNFIDESKDEIVRPYFNGEQVLIFKKFLGTEAMLRDIQTDCKVVKTKFFGPYLVMEGGTKDLYDLMNVHKIELKQEEIAKGVIAILKCLLDNNPTFLYPDMKLENLVLSRCEYINNNGKQVPLIIDIDEMVTADHLALGNYKYTPEFRDVDSELTPGVQPGKHGYKICVAALLVTLCAIFGTGYNPYNPPKTYSPKTYRDLIGILDNYREIRRYIPPQDNNMDTFDDYKTWLDSLYRATL